MTAGMPVYLNTEPIAVRLEIEHEISLAEISTFFRQLYVFRKGIMTLTAPTRDMLLAELAKISSNPEELPFEKKPRSVIKLWGKPRELPRKNLKRRSEVTLEEEYRYTPTEDEETNEQDIIALMEHSSEASAQGQPSARPGFYQLTEVRAVAGNQQKVKIELPQENVSFQIVKNVSSRVWGQVTSAELKHPK